MAIAIGILYYLGVISCERMNRDIHDFDPDFPIVGLAWILWPLTIFAFFMFFFLIPKTEKLEKSTKPMPRFVRWYNKRQSK